MTLAFSFQTAALMALVAGGLLFYLHFTAAQSIEAKLDAAARRVHNELADAQHSNGFDDFLVENGDSLKTEGLALLLVDSRGKVLRASQHAAPSWPRSGRDGWRIRTLPYGARTVVIGAYWRTAEATLEREGAVLLALSICVVLGSAFGAWWLVGRTLLPIDALSRQARQTSGAERLHTRLAAPSRDAEVVELVATLNALLANIARTAEARGRFYAAASHEIRTPLQGLSGHLELALSRERSREEYRGAVEEASRQTTRLTALIQGLLLLNQLDRPMPETLARETVDLGDLAERYLVQFAPLIERRQLEVTEQIAPAEASAFPEHAGMLLRNLIENAAKYALPRGRISVYTAERDGTPVFTIRNSFPAGVRLDTEALFEPFFRPDEARASETGGNGLGLAICRAIAVANGWSISLAQSEGEVTVQVTCGTNGCVRDFS